MERCSSKIAEEEKRTARGTPPITRGCNGGSTASAGTQVGAEVLRGTKDRHRRQVSTYKGHCQECTRERKRTMCGGMCGCCGQSFGAPYNAYYPPPAGVQPYPQPAPVAGGAAPPPPPYYPPQTAATASVQPAPHPAGYPPGYPPPPQPAAVQPSYNPTYVNAQPSAPPVTVIVQQQPNAQTAPTQVVRPPPQQNQSGSSGMGMAGAAAVGMMAGAAVAGVAAAAHSHDRHHHHHSPPHLGHRPGLLSRGHHGPVNVHIHPQPTHWAARLAMRAKERRHH